MSKMCVPLLDFMKAGEEGNGYEDDDCFLAVTDFDLGYNVSLSGSYVE